MFFVWYATVTGGVVFLPCTLKEGSVHVTDAGHVSSTADHANGRFW